MFSLRIVTTDHYLSSPLHSLDVQYSDLRGSEVKKVPVVRVYGSTPAGQKTCMHIHGVFPYLYVPYDGTAPLDRYLRQFAASLDKAINVAQGHGQSNLQHVYKIVLVSGLGMYGYHNKDQPFLKIYMFNPQLIRKAADLLLGGAVMNKPFQPHESHIPYTLQLFIDYNLYGMNLINVAAVKFRRKLENENEKQRKYRNEVPPNSQGSDGGPGSDPITPLLSRTSSLTPALKHWDYENIPSDLLLDGDVERQSVCELEVDVVAADILNRLEVNANVGANPGLAALWEDERLRRRERGESVDNIAPPASQERVGVDVADSEKILRERLKQIIQDLEPYMDSQSDSEMDMSQDDAIPSTQASQLDLHLSMQDDIGGSQDTVMMENDDVEAMINEASVRHVVSRGESFCERNPDLQNVSSQDRSLVDILAALAGDTSLPSSQQAIVEAVALEEHDSMLAQTSNLRDTELDKLEEEEILEMSQKIWDGEERDAEGTDYNIEGMDSTWIESQSDIAPSTSKFPAEMKEGVTKGDKSESDDSDSEIDVIPQYDGPVDENPTKREVKDMLTKRLGMRGQAFMTNRDMGMMQEPTNHYGQQYGATNMGPNYGAYQTQQQHASMSMGPMGQVQQQQYRMMHSQQNPGWPGGAMFSQQQTHGSMHPTQRDGPMGQLPSGRMYQSASSMQYPSTGRGQSTAGPMHHSAGPMMNRTPGAMHPMQAGGGRMHPSQGNISMSQSAMNAYSDQQMAMYPGGDQAGLSQHANTMMKDRDPYGRQIGQYGNKPMMSSMGQQGFVPSYNSAAPHYSSKQSPPMEHSSRPTHQLNHPFAQQNQSVHRNQPMYQQEYSHQMGLPQQQPTSMHQSYTESSQSHLHGSQFHMLGAGQQGSLSHDNGSMKMSSMMAVSQAQASYDALTSKHSVRQQQQQLPGSLYTANASDRPSSSQGLPMSHSPRASNQSPASDVSSRMTPQPASYIVKRPQSRPQSRTSHLGDAASKAVPSPNDLGFNDMDMYNSFDPHMPLQDEKLNKSPVMSGFSQQGPAVYQTNKPMCQTPTSAPNYENIPAQNAAQPSRGGLHSSRLVNVSKNPIKPEPDGQIGPYTPSGLQQGANVMEPNSGADFFAQKKFSYEQISPPSTPVLERSQSASSKLNISSPDPSRPKFDSQMSPLQKLLLEPSMERGGAKSASLQRSQSRNSVSSVSSICSEKGGSNQNMPIIAQQSDNLHSSPKNSFSNKNSPVGKSRPDSQTDMKLYNLLANESELKKRLDRKTPEANSQKLNESQQDLFSDSLLSHSLSSTGQSQHSQTGNSSLTSLFSDNFDGDLSQQGQAGGAQPGSQPKVNLALTDEKVHVTGNRAEMDKVDSLSTLESFVGSVTSDTDYGINFSKGGIGGVGLPQESSVLSSSSLMSNVSDQSFLSQLSSNDLGDLGAFTGQFPPYQNPQPVHQNSQSYNMPNWSEHPRYQNKTSPKRLDGAPPRKRGRPPKNSLSSPGMSPGASVATGDKKRRGRPRKSSVTLGAATPTATSPSQSVQTPFSPFQDMGGFVGGTTNQQYQQPPMQQQHQPKQDQQHIQYQPNQGYFQQQIPQQDNLTNLQSSSGAVGSYSSGYGFIQDENFQTMNETGNNFNQYMNRESSVQQQQYMQQYQQQQQQQQHVQQFPQQHQHQQQLQQQQQQPNFDQQRFMSDSYLQQTQEFKQENVASQQVSFLPETSNSMSTIDASQLFQEEPQQQLLNMDSFSQTSKTQEETRKNLTEFSAQESNFRLITLQSMKHHNTLVQNNAWHCMPGRSSVSDVWQSPVVRPSPSPAYTYKFHVPSADCDKHYVLKSRRSPSPGVVRMHPKDARKFSLLKIGREVIELKKLSTEKVKRIKSELLKGALIESIPPPLRKIPQEDNPVISNFLPWGDMNQGTSMESSHVESAIHNSIQGYSNQTSDIIQYGNRYTGLSQFGTAQTTDNQKDTISVNNIDVNVLSDDTPVLKHLKSSPENKDKSKSMFRNKNIANIPHLKKYRAGFSYFGKGSIGRGGHTKFRKSHPVLRPEFEDDSSIVLKDVSLNDGIITPIKSRTPIAGRSPAYSSGQSVGELDAQDKDELESKLKSLYDIDLNQSQNAQMFNDQEMFGDDEENSEDDEESSENNSANEDEDRQMDSMDNLPDKDKRPQNLNKIDMENKENLFTSSKETISNSSSEAKVMVKTVPEIVKVKERRDTDACVDEMCINPSKENAEEDKNKDVLLAEGIKTDSEFSKVNPANISMSEESEIPSSNDSDFIQNSNELDLDERNHSTAFYGKFKNHFKEKFAQYKTTSVEVSNKCKAENQDHSVDEKPNLEESKSKLGASSDINEKELELDDGKSNQRQFNSEKPHITKSRSNSGNENHYQRLDSSKLPRNRSRSNSSDSRGSTSRCGSRRSSTALSVESVILSSESSSVLSGSMHTAKKDNKVKRKKRKSHSLSSGSRKSSRSSSVDNDTKKTKKSKTAKYHKRKPYNIDSDSDGVPGVDYIVTGKFKGYREMKVKVSKIAIDSKTEVVNVNDFMKKVATEKNGFHCNNMESLGINDHKQIATNAKQVPVKGFSAEFERFLASKANTLNGDDDDALISDINLDEKPHYVIDTKEKGRVQNVFETKQLEKSVNQIETHDEKETNSEVYYYETDEKHPQSAIKENVTLDLDDIESSTLKEDTKVLDQIDKEEKLKPKGYDEHDKETEGHNGGVTDAHGETIEVAETHTDKDKATCAKIDKERKPELQKSTDKSTEKNNENNNETKTDILYHGTNDAFDEKCKTVCNDIDKLNDIKEPDGNNCNEVLTNGPIQETVKDILNDVPEATNYSKVKEVDQSCDREKGNKGFSSSTEDEREPVQAAKKKQIKTIRKYSDVKKKKRSSDRLANAFCGPKGKRKRPQKKKKPLKWMSTLDALHDATMEKLTANKVYDGDIVSDQSPAKCQDDNEVGTKPNPVISVIAPDFEVYCDRAIDYDDNYSDTLFRLAYYSPLSSENGNNSSPQPLSPEEMKQSAADSDDMKVEKLIEHREQKMTLADIMKSVRQSDEDSMTKQSDDGESRNTDCDLTVKADLPVNAKADDVAKSQRDIKACIGEEDEIKRTDMSSPPDLGPPVIHRYYSDHDLTEDQNPPPNLTPNRKMSSDSKNDFESPCVSEDGTVPSLHDSYHELNRNPPPFLTPYRSPRLPPSPRGSPRMAEIAGNKPETPNYLESPCEPDYKVKPGKSPGANSSTGSINVIHSEQFSDISDDDFHYDGKGDDADTSPIIATQNQKTLNMDGSLYGKLEALDKETKLREIKEFEERLARSDMNRNNIFDIMSSQNGQIRECPEIKSTRKDCVSTKEQFVRNVQLLLNKEPNIKTMNDIPKGNSMYDSYNSTDNDRLEKDQAKHIHKDNGMVDSDTALSVKRCHSVSTDRDIMESFHHSQVLTDNSRSLFDSVSSGNGFWNAGLHHGAANGFKTSEKSGEISKTSTNPLNALIDFHKNHAPPKWSSFQSFQSFDDNGERIIKYAHNSHSKDLFESSAEKSRNSSQHSHYQPSFNRSLSESNKYDYSIVRNRKLNDSIIKSVAYQVNMRDKELNSRNHVGDKITEEPPTDKGGKTQKSKQQKDNSSNQNTSTESDINEQDSKDYSSEGQGRENKGQDKGQKSDCKTADSMNGNHVITPLVPPPSRADVQHSFGRFGLGAMQTSGPFYSNHRDVPCKPRESGGQVFKVPSSLVKDLDEFSHSASITRLEDWRGLFCVNDNVFMSQSDSNVGVQEQLVRHPQLKYALTGDRPVVICPFDGPPSLNKVTKWCKGRKLYKDLKNQALQKEKHGSCDNQESKRDDNVPAVERKGNAALKNDDNVESEGNGRSPPKVDKLRLNLFTGKREFCVDEDSNDSSRDGSQGTKTALDKQGPSTGIESLPGSPKCNPELDISPTGLPQIDSQTGSPSLTGSQPENEESFLHSTPLLRRQSTELFAPECTPISEGRKPVETDEQAQFVTPKRIKSLRSRRPSAGPDRSLRQSLINTQLKRQFVTPETHPNEVSQIEGPSLKNSFGFKMSQPNFQTAKTLHEFQHLTVMSVEVHAETRGDLQPDPEVDAIQAVFYSIFNDVPPEQGTRYETGVFILDPASANQEKDNKATANQEKDDKSSANQNRDNRCTSPKPGSSFDNKGGGELKTLLQKSAVFDLKVLYFSTELELLYHVKDFITEWDPDILVGYEIQMLSWGYILQRASVLSYNLTQAISRVPTFKHSSHHSAERDEWGADHHTEIHIAGRIVLNLWRILRHEVTLNIYSFENVAFHVLHRRVPKYSCKSLTSWFNHRTHHHRWKVIDYYVTRVKGQLDIMDKLDLVGRTSEFARVFGIEFYHVLSRGSQYRVESMMLRVAKPLNYIPVSPSVHQRARMKAPECIALTLEPESKFYTDPVIVLDFQSLYPSIMIAYNYCFSTCLGRLEWFQNAHEGPIEFGCTSLNLTASTIKDKQKDVTISPNGIVFCKQSVKRGVLPLMVEEILNTRLMVKKAMPGYKDDKTLSRLLHARQLGLKLIANVTYGYTAANFSGRMPCIEVGDSIVRKARETLERSIKLVEETPEWGAKVIYGDTDSMFLLLKGCSKDQAFKIGQDIAQTVTRMFPQPIKLKFEKVYLPCVLQTKKRYCGFMYETPDQKEPVYDAKGIETVRRDSCSAVSKMLERSIKILFTTKDVSQVKSYVQQQCKKVMEGTVSLQDYVFAKEYRGIPGYKPGACVPALEISKKLLRADRRSEPRVGERVPYVIVYGSPGLPLIQLVRQPMEVLQDLSLRLNSVYYITKQILPPLSRFLSLLGVDVFSWYNEMPHSAGRVATQFGVTAHNRKGTISQYFATSNCPLCDEMTKQPVCWKCMRNPQLVCISLNDKIRYWERVNNHLEQICKTCTGSPEATTGKACISLDCPILYRKSRATGDMDKVTAFRNILEKVFKM